MDRSGNATLSRNHIGAREFGDLHHGRIPEKSAELDRIADRLAGDRNDSDGGRLLVDHADGRLVGDNSRNGCGGRIARYRDHVETHRADARHRLELLDRKSARIDRVNHALILRYGNERARKAADIAGGHHAALFDVIVQKRERGSRAGSAGMLKTDLLEDVGHRVADRGSRSKRQVDNAEGNAEPGRRLLGDELTYARNLERSLFNRLAESLEIGSANGLQYVIDHAGARHADIDDRIGFAHAVERACHERIVVWSVAENDYLRAADRVAVLRALGGRLYDLAHKTDGIHVDARLGGADIHRGADSIRHGHRLGDGADQKLVGPSHALRDDCGIASDEVDADLLGRAVESLGNLHEIGGLLAASRADNRRGRDRNALVDDGNAELATDFVAGLHEILGVRREFRVDVVACRLERRVRAVKKRNAHRDRTNIKILFENHLVRLENFGDVDHLAPLYAVHLLEDLGLLAANLEPHRLTEFAQSGRNIFEALAAGCDVYNHHHVEILLDDSLGDIKNIDVVLREIGARLGDDADDVLTDNCYNRFFHDCYYTIFSMSVP